MVNSGYCPFGTHISYKIAHPSIMATSSLCLDSTVAQDTGGLANLNILCYKKQKNNFEYFLENVPLTL